LKRQIFVYIVPRYEKYTGRRTDFICPIRPLSPYVGSLAPSFVGA